MRAPYPPPRSRWFDAESPPLLRRRTHSGNAPHDESLRPLAFMATLACVTLILACNAKRTRRLFTYEKPPPALADAARAAAPTPRHCRFLRDATLKVVPASCGVGRADESRRVRLAVLVTGLGGAGSWSAALRLRDAGLLVEHERLGRDGAVSWLYAVRDDERRPYPVGPAARAVRGRDVRFHKVLHLVRCPPANVAALSTHRRDTLAFAARALAVAPPPADDVGELADQGARSGYRLGGDRDRARAWLAFLAGLWSGWNERVDSFADARARVEDGDTGADLCALVDLLAEDAVAEDGAAAPRRCASTASSPAAAIDAAHHVAKAWSHWVFSNGEYNPQRCLRGACDGADGAAAAHHHRPHANVSWADLKDALGGKKFARFADVAAKFGYDAGRDCAAVAPARGRRRR